MEWIGYIMLFTIGFVMGYVRGGVGKEYYMRDYYERKNKQICSRNEIK